MLVVLQTNSQHGRAKRIQLRTHQIAKFGRSEWADYSFSNDRVMADMHFEVHCVPEGCRLATLDSDAVVFVNGVEVAGPMFVQDGDEIKAGTTVLSVRIDGATAKQSEVAAEEDPVETEIARETVAAAATGVASLAATCIFLDLSKDVQQLADASESPDALIQRLADEEQFLDALRIRAFLLPNREAVWWGCVSVQDELSGELDEDQGVALAAALDWVTDPTEERRRKAENASNVVRNQGVGGMLALSAFWSEGSIGPPDTPEVPADERLVCQGLAAALATGAYLGNPDLGPKRLIAFLDKGKLVADGELPIPQAS